MVKPFATLLSFGILQAFHSVNYMLRIRYFTGFPFGIFRTRKHLQGQCFARQAESPAMPTTRSRTVIPDGIVRERESESTPIPLTPFTPPSRTGTTKWTRRIERFDWKGVHTCICLGCRSIASAEASFRAGFPRRLGRRFQRRGESPAKSVAEQGEAGDSAAPFREGSPRGNDTRDIHETSLPKIKACSCQGLFRGPRTRNSPCYQREKSFVMLTLAPLQSLGSCAIRATSVATEDSVVI